MEGSRVDTNIQKVLTRLSNAHHLIGGEYLLFDPKNNTFYTNESKFYLVDNKWHVKTCDVNELSTTLDALSLQKKNKGPGRPNLTDTRHGKTETRHGKKATTESMKAMFVDEFARLKEIEVDANVKVTVVEWSDNEEQRKFELIQILHGMKVKSSTGVKNKLRVVNENCLKFYYFKKEFERRKENFFEEFKDAMYSITQSITDKKKFDKMVLDVYGKNVRLSKRMFNFSQGLPDEDTFIMSDVPKTYWSHLKAKDWSDVCKILHLKFDEILETVEIVDSSDENESE